MKNFWKVSACTLLALSMAACSSGGAADDTKTDDSKGGADAASSDALSGTYSYHVGGYDWGAGTDKVIVKLSKKIDSVDKDTFKVTETKQNTDWTKEDTPVIEDTYDRVVEDAYLSDAEGNKVDEASDYATLDLYVSPSDGSPLLYTAATGYNTWSDPYYLEITLADGAKLASEGTDITELTIEKEATGRTTDADKFEVSSFEAGDGVKYEYGLFTPEEKSKTLFVWLHGKGEGGKQTEGDLTDPYVTSLANKVTAYTGEDFQKLTGGANVLVPQCPTFWMASDDSSDPNISALESGLRESYYTKSLVELIDKVKADTGSEKVVVAGCSNGGYMTMILALEQGDKYDAYIPICEALKDEYITDEDIQKLKDLPMYFIYAANDPTVVPDEYEIPTLKRLEEAGASKVVAWVPDKVVDTSGKYKDEDGNPHEYSGHWSWVYFDNNEANDEGQPTVFEWIGEQVK